MRTLNRQIMILTLITMALIAAPLFSQGMGGGGGMGGGHNGGGMGGGHNGGGMGGHPDSLVFVDLSGTVLIDSVAWGSLMDLDEGCAHWDSSFMWGTGNGHQGNHWGGGFDHPMNPDWEGIDPEMIHDRDSLRAVFFLDVDEDAVADYVLNFGPYWYEPIDSTLERPQAGDQITITGALMSNSQMWDVDVVVVTVLNGGDWRVLGPMHDGGGMMPIPGAPEPVLARHENSPNPFNPSTTISIEFIRDAQVQVSIYDLRGREIRVLANQQVSAGSYTFFWDGRDGTGQLVPSGIYLYTIQSGNQITSSQITLLK